MIRIQQRGLGETQEECIRDIQLALAQKSYIPFLSIDGTWNSNTTSALTTIYGATWDKDPGGPCAIARRLNGQSVPAATYPPIAQPSSYRPPAAPPMAPPSMFSTPVLIAGGAAALLAFLLISRR